MTCFFSQFNMNILIFLYLTSTVNKLFEQKIKPEIEESWKNLLIEDFNSSSFMDLRSFLKSEKESQTIFPAGADIFSAFNSTPFDKVKVVIIGQDPYHGEGQAHGLSFSVPKGIKLPPSLKNIFKELKNDLGFDIPDHGNLTSWAEQGVLLLNATLTVRKGVPGSHQGRGWEAFTDAVISKLSGRRENLVFLLWGRFAQEKSVLIDGTKHLILKAAHPSPFSAHSGFFNCRHFSKTNSYLLNNGIEPVNWNLNE